MKVWTTHHIDGTMALPSDAQDVKLAFIFASPSAQFRELAARIRSAHPAATILTSTTAGEFVETQDSKGGMASLLVSGDLEIRAAMSAPISEGVNASLEPVMATISETQEGYAHRTCVVLVDPLAGHGEELVLTAASSLGPGVQFAGGAAGDDLAMSETTVGLNDSFASGRAVFAMVHSKAPLAIGVAHGHAPLSTNTHTVSKAEGNIVQEVDGRPAWDVWVEETREHFKEDADALDVEGRSSFLLRYEAGLDAGGGQLKIRAPLARTDDGGLQFATAMPEGSVFGITESSPERQRASASLAANAAKEKLGAAKIAGAVVFDCICRNLILKDDFKHAVSDMSKALGSVPLAGFETYGEIALSPTDLSGFHNTTSVMLVFPADD